MTSPVIHARAPAARRPWPRFSLRSLLLGSFVLAAGLGVVSNALVDLRREQPIVAQIRAIDGRCDFDQHRLGLLGRVRSVAFESNSAGHQAAAANLRKLHELEHVELNTVQATDQIIPELVRIPRLKSLSLGSTRITPAGLRRLREAKSLQSITLTGQAIDDEIVQAVADLPQLQTVMLFHTKVTASGLQALDTLPNLRHLHLVDNTPPTPPLTGLAATP